MNTVVLRRKVNSGFIRLRMAKSALVAGGRMAWSGIKASLTFAPVKAKPGMLAGSFEAAPIPSPAPAADLAILSQPATAEEPLPPEPAPVLFPPEPSQVEKTFAFALTLNELQMRPPPKVRPTTPREKRVVMFAVSALRIDPRVEREARALVEAGFEVVIVAPDLSDPPHASQPLDWGPNISFDLLPNVAVAFMGTPPWFYSAPMVAAGAKHAAFAYHAHDLWTTLIALDCASRTGSLAVLDYHEWTSENVSWDAVNAKWAPHQPDVSHAFRNLENIGIRLGAITITVNQTIATELEKDAGAPPGTVSVIRNVPKLDATPTKDYPPLKEQFGLPEDSFVVLYQGGTGPSRMLEPIIEGMAYAPGATLIIRGPSLDLFGDDYRALAEKCGVSDQLILAPAVPSHDVVAAARGADLGIYTVADASKNFRYALPNKIFEYLAADVPLAIANYPEVMKIVQEHRCGVHFDPHDPRSIGEAIASVQRDPARQKQLLASAPAAFDALDGASEWARFAALYEDLWRQSLTAQ
jgi:glycosyltransferase involved in cell wall biosynthesis